jgi:hypothetical protein
MWAEDQASQEYIISIRMAFILEASLLCISGATVGPSEFCGLWVGQIPTHSRSPIVCAEEANLQPKEYVGEWGKQPEH